MVIGLNEAKNLDNTFKAINELDYPAEKLELIYCDTGSSDNSVEIAKKYTNRIFVEKNDWPTPGLARNRGLLEAKYDIVHFIDGDIQIDKDYLKKAVAKIKEPNIHAVYGYLQEKSKKGLNRILISHWSQKIKGFSNATGGGGTYKKSCLLKVNGYDERIKRGQETELGSRFKEAGYQIFLMDIPMGVHKYKITNILHLFKRHFDNGMSLGFNFLLQDKSKYLKKQAKKTKYLLLYTISMFIIITAVFFYSFKLFLLICLLLLVGFHLFFLKKVIRLGKKKEKYQIVDIYIMLISFPIRVYGIIYSFLKVLIFKFRKKNLIKRKSKLKY